MRAVRGVIALLLVDGADGLQLKPKPPHNCPPRLELPTLPTAAVAAATLSASLPVWADDWWTEANKPPITLTPGGGFTVSPVGYSIFAGYLAYLAWTVLRPPTDAEQKANEKAEAAAEQAEQASVAFLATAAGAPGATVTSSGLVFEELAAGAGATPSLDQKVKVQYTGTLSDGTVFDCSRTRGEPIEFKLNQVIKGWQEGVALMRPGGRAKLTVPAALAYGDMEMGQIPARSALQFDVELLEVMEDEGLKLPWM